MFYFMPLEFILMTCDCLHSSNKDNPDSNPVSLNLTIVANTRLDLRG